MKTFKKLLKEQRGFTLVELMVVVAIIGVLSAVAVPNFKKYQAKAKTSEAKVQLAAAYTALQAFYGDFGVYSTCLAYMGFDPGNEWLSRYYGVGILKTGAVAAVAGVTVTTSSVMASTAYTTAQNSGLGTDCQANSTFPEVTVNTAAPSAGNTSYFQGGKTVGGTTQPVATNTWSGIGTQATGAQNFVLQAQGNISTDKVANTNNSVFQMNSNKVTFNTRSGY